ncbi:MAG: DUF4863 family protein [Planctomycetota bacterium]
MTKDEFCELLRPLATDLTAVDIEDGKQVGDDLNETHPLDSESLQKIRKEAIAGWKEGWLMPKEAGSVKFGRVAKDLQGFSVDAVLMSTPGPRHRHPNGELDLCFAIDGTPKFDGQPEGWVCYPPDSTHIPTVTDGTMLILYFLPGGEIEFLAD